MTSGPCACVDHQLNSCFRHAYFSSENTGGSGTSPSLNISVLQVELWKDLDGCRFNRTSYYHIIFYRKPFYIYFKWNVIIFTGFFLFYDALQGCERARCSKKLLTMLKGGVSCNLGQILLLFLLYSCKLCLWSKGNLSRIRLQMHWGQKSNSGWEQLGEFLWWLVHIRDEVRCLK